MEKSNNEYPIEEPAIPIITSAISKKNFFLLKGRKYSFEDSINFRYSEYETFGPTRDEGKK